MEFIDSLEELETHYGTPKAPSLVKVARHVTPEYRAWIEASPFLALATIGPDGLDCSPRGDAGQALRILDDKTIAMPDRRGNDRIDSLSNIVRDPRVSLMSLIPGSGTVIRINGTARITADVDLRDSFAVKGKPPRTVILVTVDEVYFQCSRAVLRSDIWNGIDASTGLPTPGDILAAQTKGAEGGPDYDARWSERAAKTMW